MDESWQPERTLDLRSVS